MPKTLILIKKGDHLVPARVPDKEWLEKQKEDSAHYYKTARKCRNPYFHRKYFAMLNHAFKFWDPEIPEEKYNIPVTKNPERFRKDAQILAGYYEVFINIKGELRKEPLSIAFDKMDENEFQEVYDRVADVLLRLILTNYDRGALDIAVVEEMKGFKHNG